MGTVIIICPSTGKPLSTGVAMDRAIFENPTITIADTTTHCPHCGVGHTWNKAGATLQD
jgi:hypothetical protein